MNLNTKCFCGKPLNTTNTQKKWCDDCRVIRDKESRRKSNQRRRDEGYKQPSKKDKVYVSECDDCDLAVGCMGQAKMDLDCYCWNGPDTNNEYYYLYERAII